MLNVKFCRTPKIESICIVVVLSQAPVPFFSVPVATISFLVG